MDALKFHNNTAMSLAHAADTSGAESVDLSEVAKGITVYVDVTAPKDNHRTQLPVENVGYHKPSGTLVVMAPQEHSMMRAASVLPIVLVSAGVGVGIGTAVTNAIWNILN